MELFYCYVLFCFILLRPFLLHFYYVLFYSISLCCVFFLLCLILFCSVLFFSILFGLIVFWFILFYSLLFCDILHLGFLWLCNNICLLLDIIQTWIWGKNVDAIQLVWLYLNTRHKLIILKVRISSPLVTKRVSLFTWFNITFAFADKYTPGHFFL